MLKNTDVIFNDIQLLGSRVDGMKIWQVGISKEKKDPVVVLSKEEPKDSRKLNLIPLDSLLNFTDPDSIAWEND